MRLAQRLVSTVFFVLLVGLARSVPSEDTRAAETASANVDRLLTSLAEYTGPPPVLLRTGKRRLPPPPAWFAAAWLCGEDGAEVPIRSMLSGLPALRRTPKASRSALLARTIDENPAVAAWALAAVAALGPPDEPTLETVRERTTATNAHVRRAACAILFHDGDGSGAAERALQRDIERDGVDRLTLQMLSARQDIGAGLAAAMTRALERDLSHHRAAYTLRAVREHARWFEPAVGRIEALVPRVGRDAVRALGGIGKAAVPSLARILSKRYSHDHREAALGSLQGQGKTAGAAFSSVARLATSAAESVRLRQQAIRTLAAISSKGEERLVQVLRGLLTDDATRQVAAAALLRHAATPELRAETIEVVESDGWTSEVLLAICELGVAGNDLAPRIVRAWQSGRFPDAYLRLFALPPTCVYKIAHDPVVFSVVPGDRSRAERNAAKEAAR